MGAPYRRVVVIGTSGSGKSTLASRIAATLGAPHTELDALFHGPNWTPASDEQFLQRVRERVSSESWVIDGNYGKAREMVWSAADLIVWLDYSFPLTFWRVLKRTARRIVRNEPLWNGNRESLRMAFSKESILLWVITTHGRRRAEFPGLLEDPRFAHVSKVRLRSPGETERWLRALA